MSEEELWDRELTKEELQKLPRALARKRNDTSLERKVRLLELWANIGVPAGIDWSELAGSRTSLRKWHDPSLKLWGWSDDVPDNPKGRNGTLITRWSDALIDIATGPRRSPESDLDALKKRVAALERQVANLIADKARLEEELVRAKSKSKKKGSTSSEGGLR